MAATSAPFKTSTQRNFKWLPVTYHVSLTDMLPRFYQHVTIATCGNNILDKVDTNRKDSYKSTPLPHLGLSDHISVMMVPS